jgi:hypothetical protein
VEIAQNSLAPSDVADTVYGMPSIVVAKPARRSRVASRRKHRTVAITPIEPIAYPAPGTLKINRRMLELDRLAGADVGPGEQ